MENPLLVLVLFDVLLEFLTLLALTLDRVDMVCLALQAESRSH